MHKYGVTKVKETHNFVIAIDELRGKLERMMRTENIDRYNAGLISVYY